MTKTTTLLLASAAVIWGLAATAQQATTEAPAEGTTEEAAPDVAKIEATADTVLATVNGQDITLGELIVIREGLPPEYQGLSDDVLFNGILDQLIQQASVAVEPEGGLPRRLELAIKTERRTLLAGEALRGVAEAAVTDEALQAAYEARFADEEPEKEFNASHILVETEEEAAALVTELEGGADFAKLAEEKSTGPSGPNGGQLGWFGLGAMVPPFEAAVVALEPGQISPPVQTQFGWHVVKLNETRDKPRPTLEEMREELADGLREEAVRAHVEAQTAAATITRIDPATIDMSVLSDTSLVDR